MEISEKKWHYRIQDELWNYKRYPENKPRSICGYFRNLVWGSIVFAVIFIVLVVTYMVATVIGIFAFLISYAFAPFFGYYPKKLLFFLPLPTTEEKDEFSVLKPRKPLFSVSGFGFYGYQIVIALFALYMFRLIYQGIVFGISYSLSSPLWGQALICFLAIIIVCFVTSNIRKTETWQLTKAYLKARKEKMCPLITYVPIPSQEKERE